MPRNISGGLTSEQITPAQFNNLVDKINSGEITPNQLARILSKVDVGESYDDAQKGWSRFFQRTLKRGAQLPSTLVEAAEGGFGIQHLKSLTDKHGVSVGTAAWAGEILHGSTIGMAGMAWELMLGHGDLIDGIELASVALPTARMISSVKGARYLRSIQKADPTMRAKIMGEAYQKTQQEAIRKLASGDRTPIKFERYQLGGKDGIEITKAEFDTLQGYGAIDKTLNYAATIAEGIELTFNPDEVLQTVAFSGVMRGLNRIIRPGQPNQFGDEYAPPPATDQPVAPVTQPPVVQPPPPLAQAAVTPEGQAATGQTPGAPAQPPQQPPAGALRAPSIVTPPPVDPSAQPVGDTPVTPTPVIPTPQPEPGASAEGLIDAVAPETPLVETPVEQVTPTPEPLEQVTPETAPTLDPTESTLETEPVESTLEPAPVEPVVAPVKPVIEPEPTPETPPVEPQAVEPALPEQTQPTPEQTPTEGAVEPQIAAHDESGF